MICVMNTLLEDTIIALSLRNMFLCVGKIGHEEPIVLSDLEHLLEFVIGANFHDLKACLLI